MNLPNWVILLLILFVCLIFVLLVMFNIPQKVVKEVKILVEVIWSTVA